MTPQEQQMIQSLMTRVNQTQLAQKDHDAEQLLRQGLGQNPDAIYILAQTVLVQDYALQQSQRQLVEVRAQLEQHPQTPPEHTSFLGSLFGHTDPPLPPPPARQIQPPPPGYAQQPPMYAPVPGYAPSPTQGFGAPVSAGGGFLRGAMQTAAGVAAGALAFEGVESLMHGFGNAAGYGSENLGGFGGGQPREEVINNYYGESGNRDSGRDVAGNSDFDSAADNNGSLSPDLEDRRDAPSADQDDSNSFADDGNSDDGSSFDDGSSYNDNSGSDDGGGGFDGGDGGNNDFS